MVKTRVSIEIVGISLLDDVYVRNCFDCIFYELKKERHGAIPCLDYLVRDSKFRRENTSSEVQLFHQGEFRPGPSSKCGGSRGCSDSSRSEKLES